MSLVVLVSVVLGFQDPAPESTIPASTGLSVRALWAHPVIRTDSREYDSGQFSGTLNLHDDADVPDRTLVGGLEVETESWRFTVFGVRLKGKKTLDHPLVFEEEQFDAGQRLATRFEGGWTDLVYRADLGFKSGDEAEARLLVGLTWCKFRFEFRSDGETAREGHPALWPVPVAGGEGRIRLFDSVDFSARVLATRIRYVNPFHADGGEDPTVVFDSVRAELGIEWKSGTGWSAGIGVHRFASYLRDTSPEDRHRVWFDAGSLAFELRASF
ncbi:MAG TPA: hypothetical protein VJS20_08960 [Gemmatimonadales bacterium]|nr:hypothetical protein [Gemmatimonadales bacterium]